MDDHRRIADVLARHYDGQPLDQLRDEHAAHHLEAAEALLRDAALTDLIRTGQDIDPGPDNPLIRRPTEPYRPIGGHTYEGDGTEPCQANLFGQTCGGTEPNHRLSEHRLTDEEKEELP